MTSVAAWLMALIGPLGKQLLVALGFGFVTYAGLDTALGALMNSAKASYGGIGGFAAVFLAMTGINSGLSIISGALVTRLSFLQLKRLIPK